MRDEWTVTEATVKNAAAQAGEDTPVVHVLLRKRDAEAIKEALASPRRRTRDHPVQADPAKRGRQGSAALREGQGCRRRHVSPQDKLVAVLNAAPLSSWQDKMELVHARTKRGQEEAARRLEPTAVRASLDAATLRTKEDAVTSTGGGWTSPGALDNLAVPAMTRRPRSLLLTAVAAVLVAHAVADRLTAGRDAAHAAVHDYLTIAVPVVVLVALGDLLLSRPPGRRVDSRRPSLPLLASLQAGMFVALESVEVAVAGAEPAALLAVPVVVGLALQPLTAFAMVSLTVNLRRPCSRRSARWAPASDLSLPDTQTAHVAGSQRLCWPAVRSRAPPVCCNAS